MNDRMNAAIYSRYSSTNQREASIEDQFRVCREYCESHNLTVVREYHDSAISGLTDDRPDFQQMIQDGEHHAFDVLVLYAVDRFSRNKYDAAIYKARLKKAGVQIVYVTSPIGEGPESILVEGLLESLAQYYSENLSRSVKRGMQGNALRGIWGPGKVPLGYLLAPDKSLAIDPATAPTVRFIFEQFAAGHSRPDIARALNAQEIKTKRGRAFTGESLNSILKNRIYTGTRDYVGQLIENAAPPIITASLFDAVQRRMETAYKARAHNKAKIEYLLTTKLYCGHCGSWMIGESGIMSGKRYTYYVCAGRKHLQSCECKKHGEPQQRLERIILDACRTALTDEHIIAIAEQAAAKFAQDAANDKELREAQDALKSATLRVDNIIAAIEKGIVSDALQARLQAAERDQKLAAAALANIAPQTPVPTAAEIAYFLTTLRDGDTSSPDFSRTLINTILNSAAVYDLPDKQSKIVLALNLTPDASEKTVIFSDTDGTSGELRTKMEAENSGS